MKILVTSGTTAGSWKIRGEQLGTAIGATVIPNATLEQQKGYDITICVKRPPKQWEPSGKVVWDMVDFWPQPAGNAWSLRELVAFQEQRKIEIGADYCVAATQQMQIDTGAELCLYHHARPNQYAAPIREKLGVVGYEGDPRYLGAWVPPIQEWCEENAASFVINPEYLHVCDVVVALRDGAYRGMATDRWKSNVKLANAQASGVPAICLMESGYLETCSGGELFINTVDRVAPALSSLKSKLARREAAFKMSAKAPEFCLTSIAKEYKSWLTSLL